MCLRGLNAVSERDYMRLDIAGVHLWNAANTIKGGDANANADVVAACRRLRIPGYLREALTQRSRTQ